MTYTTNCKEKLDNLSKKITIPSHIQSYFENIDPPNPITFKFVADVGVALLKEKIAHVEMENMGRQKRLHKRLPEKLNVEDIALALMILFDFKNIEVSGHGGSNNTVLGMYENNKDAINYGTYFTETKKMREFISSLSIQAKSREKDDVMTHIIDILGTVSQTREKHLFPVKNGIYNKQLKELMPFHPDYIYLTKIPVEYKDYPVNPIIVMPDGETWDVESWIQDIAIDTDTQELIWQVIADCIQPNNPRFRSIWFYSDRGNNGKGTIGQLIKNLLGRNNYASLSVSDFTHEFMKDALIGVAANIADENDVDTFIDSVKDYKASVTGDDININRKYEKPLRFQFLGTNIQMMNGLPKTKDKSESFYRRLIIVPFVKSFTNNGERTYIKSDYIHRQDVLEYVLHKTINMDFDEFTIPISSSTLLENYKERNNPVMEFWNEKKDEFQWDVLPVPFLYSGYQFWFDENNPSGKIISRTTFVETLTSVIQANGDGWEYKKRVRPGNHMDADEPLIYEWNLHKPDKNGNPSQWVVADYKGSNPKDHRNFVKKDKYAAFVKV